MTLRSITFRVSKTYGSSDLGVLIYQRYLRKFEGAPCQLLAASVQKPFNKESGILLTRRQA